MLADSDNTGCIIAIMVLALVPGLLTGDSLLVLTGFAVATIYFLISRSWP